MSAPMIHTSASLPVLASRKRFESCRSRVPGSTETVDPIIGTAAEVADELQRWFEEEAADGFIFLMDYFPTSLEDFKQQVVPELQRRGLHRTAYEGTTLRDNLGLSLPRRP